MKINHLRSKIVLVAVVLCLIGAVGVFVFRTPILSLVIQFAVKYRLTDSTIVKLPDGLHIGLCGAGAQLLVDPKRSEPCVIVLAGTSLFIVDVGSKSTQIIEGMGFGAGDVNAVFLTSPRSHRINGLGQLLTWNWMLSGKAEPIPVYGPEGVAGIVSGLQQTYLPDSRYKLAQLDTANIQATGFGGRPVTVNIASKTESVTLIKTPDLEVIAFPLDQFPVDRSVGYLFRYKGRSAVITGDSLKSNNIKTYSKDVDLLVHDALSPTLMRFYLAGARRAGFPSVIDLFSKMVALQATPEEAATTARDANAKFLLLAGITPPLQLPGTEKIFMGASNDLFSGPIKIGSDGDFVSLPANSSEISFKSILSRF